MSDYRGLHCKDCKRLSEIYYSSARVAHKEKWVNSIFIHNGNLISYTKVHPYHEYCTVCRNERLDCIYIKDGEYHTISKYSNVTDIECSIKKRLYQRDAFVTDIDLGIFISITPHIYRQKLLFLRGIKIDYNPKMWANTYYSSHDDLYKSSKIDLQQSIFTLFVDEEENTYLIDREGNLLTYETLLFTGECYRSPDSNLISFPNDWQIYANDNLRVKIYGGFESVEILTDRADVGKHTKPALRGDEL